MIEEFKNIQIEDNIIFTDEQVIDLFEAEELTVTGVKSYSFEDEEMVIIEMDESYLVVHNFESDEKYFVYQLVDEGETGDLEDNGYKFLNEDDDFRNKIVIREDGKSYTYHHSGTGALYGLTRGDNDDTEVSICEFISSSARLSNILIEKEGDKAYIMQGFEVESDCFEI